MKKQGGAANGNDVVVAMAAFCVIGQFRIPLAAAVLHAQQLVVVPVDNHHTLANVEEIMGCGMRLPAAPASQQNGNNDTDRGGDTDLQGK